MLHTTKRLFAIFGALALLTLGYTQAQAQVEIEPNDTFATGQLLTPNAAGMITLTGLRETSATNDFNDFFRFQATAGQIISMRVLPGNSLLPPPGFPGDSVLRLLSPTGITLAENDDCTTAPLPGISVFQSCILNFSVTTSGLHGAAIRGFGNDVFNYTFTVAGLTSTTDPIPEPATMILLGTGLLGVAAKVRNRRFQG